MATKHNPLPQRFWSRLGVGVLTILAGGVLSGCASSKDQLSSQRVQAATDETPSPSPAALPDSNTNAAAHIENPVVIENAGFETPESVLYVATQDVYLVSNINGTPLAKDNNGFISRVLPNGTVANLKWIAGGQNDAALHAPKGMAISDSILYVADIDTVHLFDAQTGAPAGDIPIAEATFLNDVSAGSDGVVYVSDTGWKAGENGFEPTGTDAVYALKNNQPKPMATGGQLHNPNGLLSTATGLKMVNASGELFDISAGGALSDPIQLPGAGLDGIVETSGGSLLISSWQKQTIYQSNDQGGFTPVVEHINSPADIGYDSKRNRVLIPIFLENKVVLQPLPVP